MVARFDGFSKPGLVDADKIKHRVLIRIHTCRDKGQYARSLCQCFDDDDARHHRPVREMAGKIGFIDCDILQGANALAWHTVEHPVDQQEWIAMWQPLEDGVNIKLQPFTHRYSVLLLSALGA